MAPSRVLLVITVYNAPEAVRRCLTSAARLRCTRGLLDVLVLDDCSPEPGWSGELVGICKANGFDYYRSPRNLGIVRNVNLGLLHSLDQNYDAVIISNSDVVYPRTLVDQLAAVADTDSSIGSVTSWSNNVSIYSIPNGSPEVHLPSQDAVDEITTSLSGHFGDRAVDIPAGVSFCIYIKTQALRRVGMMDPIFGRGYCEETDWSLRSLALGYRLVLAPGCFVYHKGQASTAGEGMLLPGHRSVPSHDAIIDHRYPAFRRSVARFLRSGIQRRISDEATARITLDAAKRHGYGVLISGLPGDGATSVRCIIDPLRLTPMDLTYRGFHHSVHVGRKVSPVEALQSCVGALPSWVRLEDRGPMGDLAATSIIDAGVPFQYAAPYPQQPLP